MYIDRGTYLRWQDLNGLEQPVKDLFSRLPDVWQAFISDPATDQLARFVEELLALHQANGSSADFLPASLRQNASDCFVLLKRYREALSFHPVPVLGSRASGPTDNLLSLKLAAQDRVSGCDVLSLIGPRVTAYGRQHLSEVLSSLDSLLDELWRTTRTDYLAEWAKLCKHRQYDVGLGTLFVYDLSKRVEIRAYMYSHHPDATKFAVDLTRQAENITRERLGMVRVGEGWVGETQLFNEVRQAFPHLKVEQHASPDWLGRQHLDVYIPELRVALEYQGPQHDGPVEYFGGQASYETTTQRDERKARLCRRRGVKLIQVRPPYNLQDVIAEVGRCPRRDAGPH